eukprot:1706774-Pyramimonas_sp.AAC.1
MASQYARGRGPWVPGNESHGQDALDRSPVPTVIQQYALMPKKDTTNHIVHYGHGHGVQIIICPTSGFG